MTLSERPRRTARMRIAPLLLLGVAAQARTPAMSTEEPSPSEQPPIEVFQAPRIKHADTQGYPLSEINSRGEGWVALSFMVDPRGKPFEVSVTDSTGDRIFEKAAVIAVERSTFEPGMLNGKAIESASELVYKFQMDPPLHGAGSEFIGAYETAVAAIKAKDKPKADTAMQGLKARNLYEDAYFGLATYYYAVTWGDEAQQLKGLTRAVATDSAGWHYLARPLYKGALLALLRLQIKAHLYAEAMDSWDLVQKAQIDPAAIAALQPSIEQLRALRADNRPYEISGSMPAGRWFVGLFKPHFQAEVSEGLISEVKLLCTRRYLYFNFDPKLQYEVKGNYGQCLLELSGAPGTRFKLIQF